MRRMKRTFAKQLAGVAAGIGLMGVLLIPSSAYAAVTNGTFESETGTSISGWTAVNSRIDLGVDTIAGCATVDTSDYSNLRDWDSQYRAGIPNDPEGNNDSLSLIFTNGPTFSTESVDASALGGGFSRTGNVARLQSSMTANPGGYVVHGPAIYSDSFSASNVDDLTIEWGASAFGDDYHVLGYLQNTSTCEQTEVVDSTGRSSAWQETVVAIPSNATYRFVFVAGTFDQSFGTVAGGTMYLDNILLTVNEERAAEAAAAAAPPPAPTRPVFDSHSFGLDEAGSPELRIQGKRFWCTDSISIDGIDVTLEKGFSSPWYEFMNADISALTPGPKTLIAQTCWGEIKYENWLTIPEFVKPKSMWVKAPSFGLNDTMRNKITAFNSSLGDGYSKVRCIVNSQNGDDLNEAFAEEICAFARSNDLAGAKAVLQVKSAFAGKGYWVNIWASGGYN